MVILRVARQRECLILRYAGLGQRCGLGADFFVKTVADATVEQQREYVAAKFGLVGVAAQDVGGLVELAFQLALGHPARRADDDGRFEGAEELVEVHRF